MTRSSLEEEIGGAAYAMIYGADYDKALRVTKDGEVTIHWIEDGEIQDITDAPTIQVRDLLSFLSRMGFR